jgi:SulP family sulfate permease
MISNTMKSKQQIPRDAKPLVLTISSSHLTFINLFNSKIGGTITYEFTRMELAGSLGDLGTMLPLLVPLIVLNGLNATMAFLLVGIFYVGAGLYYKIPIPVQPLKAVAVLAIAGGFPASLIAASGLIMGGAMLWLGVTGMIKSLTRIFSKPVIRGIQATLGLLLFVKGVGFIVGSNVFMNGDSLPLAMPVNLLMGGTGILIAGLLLTNTRFPAAIAVVGFGFLIGLASGVPAITLGPQAPSIQTPTLGELRAALLFLVVPQIPLTISNAVVSTSDLSKKYFKRGSSRVTPRALATGMGIANLGAGALGGAPMCHGSGGLAAHHRFGARTGGANLMIGGIFIVLALVFGSSAAAVLGLIPLSILGVLLLFTGSQMMGLVLDLKRRDVPVALTIIGVALATNMTAGFIVGIILYYLLRGWDEKGQG